MKYRFFFFSIVCFFFSSVHATVEMGRGSYGTPKVLKWDNSTKASVGKFCSIASEVVFILGGDHRIDWVTTYPFSTLWPEASHILGHPTTKGDIVIGNDVWIGFGSTILSGVHVGNGAVIGAKAVVTKNVPPYAIVGGNPAKILKYRFDEETIKILEKIEWWNWSDSRIKKAIPYLLNNDVQGFIGYCKRKKLL